jgi:hypothetical protein
MESPRFTRVVLLNDQLYVIDQKDANGPGVAVLPPHRLQLPVDAKSLGYAISESLDRYQPDGEGLVADEWERLNQELVQYFGIGSISTFEKKKRDVTVRQIMPSLELSVFNKKGTEVCSGILDFKELGAKVMEVLGLARVQK